MDAEVKEENKPSTSDIKTENEQLCTQDETIIEKDSNELKYFDCNSCNLRQKYEYFGKHPPFLKSFVLLENAYVIEDPSVAPKQGQILIIGSHCINCRNMVCKDTSCSLYYKDTFCIDCAKSNVKLFPKIVQEKLNKIVK